MPLPVNLANINTGLAVRQGRHRRYKLVLICHWRGSDGYEVEATWAHYHERDLQQRLRADAIEVHQSRRPKC